MKISALILAKNEEEMIGDCIKQLDFVDEILVLDQNSTDDTSMIASKLGARVLKTNSNRFDLCRNTLKEEAKYNWLLYVDADERISVEAGNKIKNLVNIDECSAYYFPRKNYVLGKWLKHGGWWPDYVPRLFRKKDLIGWQGEVHESPVINGKVGYVKNTISHLTARNIAKMLEKSIKWAKIEAKLYADNQHANVSTLKVLKATLSEFLNRYFFKLGLLDGIIGLIEAIFQSLHRAMILTYLWEMQNKTQEKIGHFKDE